MRIVARRASCYPFAPTARARMAAGSRTTGPSTATARPAPSSRPACPRLPRKSWYARPTMPPTCGLGSASRVGRGSVGGACAKAGWNPSLATYFTTMACAGSTPKGRQPRTKPCYSVQWRTISKAPKVSAQARTEHGTGLPAKPAATGTAGLFEAILLAG
jgi:hypothetical protein